jgi:hypothetical protein
MLVYAPHRDRSVIAMTRLQVTVGICVISDGNSKAVAIEALMRG